ncbi:hypothetical protein [Flavobacterium sp. SM2513]|uniref:hypothetical protein n=1 Tax=Flavobacterium sp. SM2513 TaxID=3424766 RepID=UPI003D7F344E
MTSYTKYNFHKYTFCIFTEVPAAEVSALALHYTSKSGSEYSFTKEGVYRKSNHWGRAANCKWRLQSKGLDESSRVKVGFALWTEFHAINENDKLYFIEVDFDNEAVQYYHKNTSDSQTNYLRTAAATTKRVKEIRNLLSNTKKLTYWDAEEDLESLLSKVVHLLITTDFNLLQIKNELLNP